ncbi:hypothetical protein [Paenibacillus sp. LHD-38]|uniref:hypothetical protein n=1 Tax=Paenibacillus sp. LHD-38 TaxID=3072143 RepID=UPI002810877A|nr:hypothetical protein [Paenibacillus sp. LHD-38]MDQ8738317.1 hypothetical protein [Paenibacillus sp. LHD-38]
MVFAGCSETKTEYPVPAQEEPSEANAPPKKPSDSNNAIVTTGLQGSVKVEIVGTDTKASYTFKNQSEETITVIGGARYTLQKDNKVVEKGAVPIKDYIDLKPGEEYKDTKSFKNLQPGSYTIQVEWKKTVATSEFTSY